MSNFSTAWSKLHQKNKTTREAPLFCMFSTLPCTFAGLREATVSHPPSHSYVPSPSCVRSRLQKDLARFPSGASQ